MNYYEKLKNGLDEKKLPYHEIREGVIEIFQRKENIRNARIVIGFDEVTGNRPWLKNYDLGHFNDEKFAAGLIACNNANKHYRWVRFYIDKDMDVCAAVDAIVSEEHVFDEMFELIVRMLNIVDELYPTFMKARWA